jgi:hypothetical protein
MPATGKTILTAAQKRFIRKNRLKVSAKDMAKKFGHSDGVVRRWMKANGVCVSRKRQRKFASSKLIGRTSSTPEMDRFLRDHYLVLPDKTIAQLLDKSHTFIKTRLRQLGLKKPKWLIDKFKRESRYQKGNIALNKGRKITEYMSAESIERSKAGRFKKGRRNHNELNDGDIVLRCSTPEKGLRLLYFIRISKAVWRELQIVEWEKKNGPIPKGHVLACKDGDTLDYRASNWYLITKAQNAIRNSGAINLPDGMVAHFLAGRKNRHLKPLLLKNKELLDLKRQSIILNRSINEQRQSNTGS